MSAWLRYQAANGALCGILAAAWFLCLAHRMPTAPLLFWAAVTLAAAGFVATLTAAIGARWYRRAQRSMK